MKTQGRVLSALRRAASDRLEEVLADAARKESHAEAADNGQTNGAATPIRERRRK